MTFTVGELASIANASLDFYFAKGTSFKQSIQNRPLVSVMERKKKNFSGGKGDISLSVTLVHGAGGTDDGLVGYTHDDTVAFYTPANIDRANYPWREHHIGLTLTHTELKIDGLSVVDTNGASTSSHSKREMHVLVGLLKEKMFDLGEQYARTLNLLLWGDGTGDALAIAGMQHIIAANPAVGVVGGIDRAVAGNEPWRNRAKTVAAGNGAVVSDPANGGALLQFLQQEYRQLRRFGGNPNTFLAGSDFIDAMETEMRANGYYSDSGFAKGGDISMGGLSFKNVNIQYDPTLDDLSLSKRAYWFDSNAIWLHTMENEWRRQHTPSRPADQFVMYRSITSTGQMVAKQCNSSLVVDIA